MDPKDNRFYREATHHHNDGGPAFPQTCADALDIGMVHTGMSLRDYFAGIALGSTAGLHDEEMKIFAERAYAMADAMIEGASSGVENPVVTDLRRQVDYLEKMQPVWTENVSAQIMADALSKLWEMLGAKNQTEATQKLQQLIDESIPF